MTDYLSEFTGKNAEAKIIEMYRTLNWLKRTDRRLRQDKFSGDLVLKYENGEIISYNEIENKIYSVRCPLHPKIEIGEWRNNNREITHLAFYCGKCRKLIRFNEDNFTKYLTNGFFPVKLMKI